MDYVKRIVEFKDMRKRKSQLRTQEHFYRKINF